MSKVIMIPNDGSVKIDLSNEKQMKELFKNAVEVDPNKEPEFVIDENGKKLYRTTIKGFIKWEE